MAVPYGLGKILDTIYSDESNELAKERLKKFCLILAGIFIIGGISNFGRVYLFNSACELGRESTKWANNCNCLKSCSS